MTREEWICLNKEVHNRPEVRRTKRLAALEVQNHPKVKKLQRQSHLGKKRLDMCGKLNPMKDLEVRGRAVARMTETMNQSEVKLKLRALNLAENNPNWLGGITYDSYPSEFDRELREKIRVRDSYTCQICKLVEKQVGETLHIHHIDYDKENLELANLISLHHSCHSRTNGDRKYWRSTLEELQKRRMVA